MSDGRTRIGTLVDCDGSMAGVLAFDLDDSPIGVFANRKAAIAALPGASR